MASKTPEEVDTDSSEDEITRPIPGPSKDTTVPAAKLPIQIKTMDGKTYKLKAKTDWTVTQLKEEFERWHGGNAQRCSLYYKAKKLQDGNTLASYKIGAGDFVMANYRSTGGILQSSDVYFIS